MPKYENFINERVELINRIKSNLPEGPGIIFLGENNNRLNDFIKLLSKNKNKILRKYKGPVPMELSELL